LTPYNEDYPKMNVVPIEPDNYGAVSVDVGRLKSFMTADCRVTAVHLYLTDHKATTINRILDHSLKRWCGDAGCDLVGAATEGEAVDGRSVLREAVSGPGYDALVDAHSRALASVAEDIAVAAQSAQHRDHGSSLSL